MHLRIPYELVSNLIFLIKFNSRGRMLIMKTIKKYKGYKICQFTKTDDAYKSIGRMLLIVTPEGTEILQPVYTADEAESYIDSIEGDIKQ
jgi:hypothetical protein